MAKQFRPETLEERRTHYESLRQAARIALGSHPALIRQARDEIAGIEKRIGDLERQLEAAPALLQRAEQKLAEIEAKIEQRTQTVGKPEGKSKASLARMVERRERLLRKLAELDKLME